MSILDIYNNPPNNGRQIRFKEGAITPAPTNYTPYDRNDQSSLRNSNLHFKAENDYGYSTTGAPNIQFANNRYFSVGEQASNLDTAKGATISDPSSGFVQEYGTGNQYASETLIQDLTTLSDLSGGTERLQSLER